MTKLLIILLIGLLFEAVGVVYLEQGHEADRRSPKNQRGGSAARRQSAARPIPTFCWAFFSRRSFSARCWY